MDPPSWSRDVSWGLENFERLLSLPPVYSTPVGAERLVGCECRGWLNNGVGRGSGYDWGRSSNRGKHIISGRCVRRCGRQEVCLSGRDDNAETEFDLSGCGTDSKG
ncbi:hypothetical protein TNCV_4946441 [Trichonephila clavipes]|nr:hypothetical protein TNCV_4946441 [Trichonephila clavipes]